MGIVFGIGEEDLGREDGIFGFHFKDAVIFFNGFLHVLQTDADRGGAAFDAQKMWFYTESWGTSTNK